jgi:lipid II:glycine glycyltransferase (peptidoglycan interpeptide bridge formation enzyme)
VERLRIAAGGDIPVSLLTTATTAPGGRYGYMPKGPATSRAQLPAAMASLTTVAEETGLAYIRVEPEVEVPFTSPALWRPAPATQPEHTSIIDLRPPAEALMAGFKPKTRYNIRLAERRGVVVDRSDDVGTFAEMARLTSARHRIQLATEPYYRALLQLLAPDDMARLYLAHHEGKALAGIIVARFAGRAIYLYGASAPHGRELMPAYLLHWRAIQDLQALGDVEYDLWGIPPDDRPGHPWSGLWQFKRGWNGRHVAYAGAFDYVANVTIWRADQALVKIRGNVRRVKSRLRSVGGMPT